MLKTYKCLLCEENQTKYLISSTRYNYNIRALSNLDCSAATAATTGRAMEDADLNSIDLYGITGWITR